MIEDSDYMQIAFAAAKKGRGQTWTNPVVGAVVVRAGHILAVGYHHRFGEAHAEVDALNQVADAVGTTMFVTLEPCSHYGKTPPCAKRLIQAGVARVVIGQRDPNPLVAGRGIKMLEAAEIAVTVLGDTGGLNRTYNFYYHRQRPLVTVKYAQSIDGKLNAAEDQRTQLTGTSAFIASQKLRAENQAIVIGERTLTIDDPELTVRLQPTVRPALRVVLVRDVNRIDRSQRLFATKGPIWLLSATSAACDWPANVSVFVGDWTPARVVAKLAEHGVQAVLVEGGSRVHAAFVASGLVDRMLMIVAPVVLGGAALPVVTGVTAARQAYTLVQTKPLGEDVLLEYWRRA